jgi:hypothetical protein
MSRGWQGADFTLAIERKGERHLWGGHSPKKATVITKGVPATISLRKRFAGTGAANFR